jgi:hypothetical protein
MVAPGVEAGLSMHDPMTIWYMLTRDHPAWKAVPQPDDIRIETSGRWTRGMHVIDRRNRAKAGEDLLLTNPDMQIDGLEFDELPGDGAGWLSVKKGNRINRIIESPGVDVFPGMLMKRLFA